MCVYTLSTLSIPPGGNQGCFHGISGCMFLFGSRFSADKHPGVGRQVIFSSIFSSLRKLHTFLHSGCNFSEHVAKCLSVYKDVLDVSNTSYGFLTFKRLGHPWWKALLPILGPRRRSRFKQLGRWWRGSHVAFRGRAFRASRPRPCLGWVTCTSR